MGIHDDIDIPEPGVFRQVLDIESVVRNQLKSGRECAVSRIHHIQRREADFRSARNFRRFYPQSVQHCQTGRGDSFEFPRSKSGGFQQDDDRRELTEPHRDSRVQLLRRPEFPAGGSGNCPGVFHVAHAEVPFCKSGNMELCRAGNIVVECIDKAASVFCRPAFQIDKFRQEAFACRSKTQKTAEFHLVSESGQQFSENFVIEIGSDDVDLSFAVTVDSDGGASVRIIQIRFGASRYQLAAECLVKMPLLQSAFSETRQIIFRIPDFPAESHAGQNGRIECRVGFVVDCE